MSTNEWLLTSDFDSFLNLDMGDDTNTQLLLLHVQTTYMTSKMGGDCWGTWLIMLGFMDLGWPRVCRRPTSVLFIYDTGTIFAHMFTGGILVPVSYVRVINILLSNHNMLKKDTHKCVSLHWPLWPLCWVNEKDFYIKCHCEPCITFTGRMNRKHGYLVRSHKSWYALKLNKYKSLLCAIFRDLNSCPNMLRLGFCLPGPIYWFLCMIWSCQHI